MDGVPLLLDLHVDFLQIVQQTLNIERFLFASFASRLSQLFLSPILNSVLEMQNLSIKLAPCWKFSLVGIFIVASISSFSQVLTAKLVTLLLNDLVTQTCIVRGPLHRLARVLAEAILLIALLDTAEDQRLTTAWIIAGERTILSIGLLLCRILLY